MLNGYLFHLWCSKLRQVSLIRQLLQRKEKTEKTVRQSKREERLQKGQGKNLPGKEAWTSRWWSSTVSSSCNMVWARPRPRPKDSWLGNCVSDHRITFPRASLHKLSEAKISIVMLNSFVSICTDIYDWSSYSRMNHLIIHRLWLHDDLPVSEIPVLVFLTEILQEIPVASSVCDFASNVSHPSLKRAALSCMVWFFCGVWC